MRSSDSTFDTKAPVSPASTIAPIERDPERRTELLSGVLEPAGLTPTRHVDRRLHHVAELGDDEAHPDAEHGH